MKERFHFEFLGDDEILPKDEGIDGGDDNFPPFPGAKLVDKKSKTPEGFNDGGEEGWQRIGGGEGGVGMSVYGKSIEELEKDLENLTDEDAEYWEIKKELDKKKSECFGKKGGDGGECRHGGEKTTRSEYLAEKMRKKHSEKESERGGRTGGERMTRSRAKLKKLEEKNGG
jgi:hypothetical protein